MVDETSEQNDLEEPEDSGDERRGSRWLTIAAIILLILLVLLLLLDYCARRGKVVVVRKTTVAASPSIVSPPAGEQDLELEGPEETAENRVPDVVGLMQADAETKLADHGYGADATLLYTTDNARGLVFEQVPAAGSVAEPGSTVSILVSLGSKPRPSVKVPRLLGDKKSHAVNRVKALGLVPKVMVEPNVNTKVSGTVYEQSPAPGTTVLPGTKVFILVTIKY